MAKIGTYTIKEIAEMADVSRATVDRVIHGRGVVSEKTAEKIRKLLDEIDYRPNLLAQSLKKGKLLKIAVMLPDPAYDIYWKRATHGIEEAISEYSMLGIHIDEFLFNPYKSASFVLNAKHVQKGQYDGVVIAPFFYRESMEFFEICRQEGIPYVTFNTPIMESDPVCFVGQDLVESGKTAAGLLDKITPADKNFLVLHLDEDIANAKHMQKKEEGFQAYVRDKGYGSGKVTVHKIESISQIDREMGRILDRTPGIGGIYVTTSKVHYIADYLHEYQLDMTLLGYDLIDENVAYLRSGIIDYLIFQNPRSQASKAMNTLIDHLVYKKEVPQRMLLPAGIVIKENLNSYLFDL